MSNSLTQSKGFTLIEVLVALALAAGLMVAVLGLTRDLARSVKPTTTVQATTPSLERMMDRVAHDLQQAETWRAGVDGRSDEPVIWMRGPLSRQTNHGLLQEPADVAYRLIPLPVEHLRGGDSGEFLLIREQKRLLDRTNRPVETELVGIALRSISLEPLQISGEGTSARVYRLVIEAEAGRVGRVVRLEGQG